MGYRDIHERSTYGGNVEQFYKWNDNYQFLN